MADTAEVVLDPHVELAEGPCWLADEGVLAWVDIEAGDVHRFDPRTGADEAVNVGTSVGFAQPHGRGGLVVGLTHAVAWLHRSGELTIVARLDEGDEDLRLNDGKVDPAGRVLTGGLVRSRKAGRARLYSVEPDGTVRLLRAGLTNSNGLGWSPDGRLLYHIDTPRLGVDVFGYDAETGQVTRECRLVTIEEGAGKPDGMCVDAEGHLWVALYGGGAVRRYTPEGRLDRVVRVPGRNVTCPGFGGPDLRDLYITTARDDERGGALHRFDPGVAGLPARAFGTGA